MTNENNTIIISLGGSLIVPDKIDTGFLIKFKELISKKIKEGFSFVLVAGGGMTARNYIGALDAMGDFSNEEKDWIGIHTTRLNANLIRLFFKELAHTEINVNPHELEGFDISKTPVLVASGWKPGCSTDFDTVLLAKEMGIKRVVNLSNIDYVYTDDPRKNPDAQKIEDISWVDFRKMVGDEWDPGMSAPFDPIASKLAEEEGLEVAIMNGEDFESLENFIDNKEFKGTVIK